MASRTEVLDRTTRDYAAEQLRPYQFNFDGKRTFRRINKEKQTVHIIEFQVGVRFMAGKFTVNLGVYSPTYFTGSDTRKAPEPESALPSDCLPGFNGRLGCLRETLWYRTFSKIFGQPNTLWKELLYAPRDHWWPFSEQQELTQKSVRQVVQLILDRGLPWLEKHDDLEAMKRVFDEIKARQKGRVPSNR